MDRRTDILDNLARIEVEEGVSILFAVESGSRAWGFESTDSDWDVRFIYVRPLDDYLSIRTPRDVIERPLIDELDISGWDLRKALALLMKSNPPLLEWLASPIVYLDRDGLGDRLRGLSVGCSPSALMHHYLSMAKGNYRGYLQGETVRRKKYLYVLRPLLAARWIEERGAPPPVPFGTMLELLASEPEVLWAIDELLAEKRSGGEAGQGAPIPVLQAWIEDQLVHWEGRRLSPIPASISLGDVDGLFRATVQ